MPEFYSWGGDLPVSRPGRSAARPAMRSIVRCDALQSRGPCRCGAVACWVPALRRTATRCDASGTRESSSRNPYRQRLVALDEARIDPLGLADHLDAVEALQHLLPDDLELQLGEAHADAAVDAEAEGK